MHNFTVGGKRLEPVQTFCYLGFDVKASGTVQHALRLLSEKAAKAMRPLNHAISRFNIPVKIAIKLFHSYIEPIILYNAENSLILTNKQFGLPPEKIIINEKIVVNLLHRKFLKYILGVNKSAPNLAIYGDTGETPLLAKGFRLMINFWYRLHTLSGETLVKKALTENISLRSPWLKTIETLLNIFHIPYSESPSKFKSDTISFINQKYNSLWKKDMEQGDSPRLDFYKTIKKDFGFEDYLLNKYEIRRNIAKLRTSTHSLEIQTGRHKNKLRSERICRTCNLEKVETETHFLIECPSYDLIRRRHDLKKFTNISDLMMETPHCSLGTFIIRALEFREKILALRETTKPFV